MLEALLLTAALTSNALLQDAPAAGEEAATLEMLAIDLRALSRIVEMSERIENHADLLRTIVDDRIGHLRGPRPDGTYQWAALEREEGARETREEKIEHVSSEAALDAVTLDGYQVYRVEVEVPPKKGLFSRNEKIFVRKILLSGIGTAGEQEIPVSVWIEPGNSWGTPLPEILRTGNVTVELGVESGREDGVAKVSVVRAKLSDDPRSPYYPAVSRLLRVREEIRNPIDRAALSRAVDEAISTIPGELEKTLEIERKRAAERRRLIETGELQGTIHPGDATPDVVNALSSIRSRLQGTLEEQDTARADLEELIQNLGSEAPPQP